jgi:hypothetical protein
MKTPFTYGLLVVGLVAIAGNSTAYAAQHDKEAEQHLEQAQESAKKGDAQGTAGHLDEAKKHLNQDKPYPQSPKHITGENPKAEHETATYGEIGKAQGHAKKGEAAEAGEHAKNAETHLKEKEQSK